MTAEQGLFLCAAAFTLASAVMVVSARRLIHAALWLIAVLSGVAILYALLQASFLVVVQVVIYIGAIAVLFIFAIMLTRRQTDHDAPSRWTRRAPAFLISLLTLGALSGIVLAFPEAGRLPPPMPPDLDAVNALGAALLSPTGAAAYAGVLFHESYVLPFEVASVLLLAALVGAIYLATTERRRRES
jgi:NADH-quinone oxidoreductase subunit J